MGLLDFEGMTDQEKKMMGLMALSTGFQNIANLGAGRPQVNPFEGVLGYQQTIADNKDRELKRQLYGEQVAAQKAKIERDRMDDSAAENQAKYFFKAAGLDYDNLDKQIGGFLPAGSSGQSIQSSPVPDITLNPGELQSFGQPSRVNMMQTADAVVTPAKPNKLDSLMDKMGWSQEEKDYFSSQAQADPKGAAKYLQDEVKTWRKAVRYGKTSTRDVIAKDRAIAQEMGLSLKDYYLMKNTPKPLSTVNVSYGNPMQATDAQGNSVFIRPPKDANSEPIVMKGFTPPEKPTEAEAKSATFHEQMSSASNEIKNLEKTFDVSKLGAQIGVGMAGGMTNALASSEAQRYRQAQEQWAEAFLRIKTGAAATQGEVDRNISTFFPQIGDSKDTLEQKRRMREKAEQDVKSMAGTAMKRIERGQAKPASQPAVRRYNPATGRIE